MFAGEDERHSRKLADRHVRENDVIDRQITSSFGFLHMVSSESPAVEIGRRVEHLRQRRALCFGQHHVDNVATLVADRGMAS